MKKLRLRKLRWLAKVTLSSESGEPGNQESHPGVCNSEILVLNMTLCFYITEDPSFSSAVLTTTSPLCFLHRGCFSGYTYRLCIIQNCQVKGKSEAEIDPHCTWWAHPPCQAVAPVVRLQPSRGRGVFFQFMERCCVGYWHSCCLGGLSL